MGSQKHDPAPCFRRLRSLRPSFVRLLARCRFVTSLSRIPRAYARLFPRNARAPGRRRGEPSRPLLRGALRTLVLRSPPVRVVRPLFVLPLVSFRSSVRRTRPWRASSSCGLRRRASGVAADRFRGPSSGLQVDFEHAWGRGTLPVDEDPGRETEGRGRDPGRRRAAGTGGRRWRYATTRRRDRPSSRWRSCCRRPTRRRPSGSTSRSRGASSRGSRRGAGRWRPRPRLARVGGRRDRRRAPGGAREVSARRLLGTHLPAAWNRRRCPPVARVT